MRKAVSILTVFVLILLVVAGCSNSTPSKPATATKGPEAGAVDKSPITLKVAGLYATIQTDNPVMKKMAEATGVTITYEQLIGDRNAKLDLWLAGGDYPEDAWSMPPANVAKYSQAGAIIPLEGLIDKYGANIKKRFGKYYDLLKDKDGHIYSLFAPNTLTETIPSEYGGFAVQYDVLKEAGYPEIKTLDQLFDILQKYYKAHPSIDGKPTVPWSGIGGNDGTYILNAPSLYASGNQESAGKGFRVDNNKVTSNLISDSNKKYYQFLNKLYSNGMLDPDYFTQTQDDTVAKLAEGRVLAGFFQRWFLTGTNNTLRASGKLDRMYANFPITFDGKIDDSHINTISPTRTGWNWVISKKSKHPERVMQLLDFAFSDEGEKLLNWGIEGVHYEVVNGKRQVKPDYQAKLNADPNVAWKETNNIFTGNTLLLGAGNKLGDGDYATPLTKESIKNNYDQGTKDLLAKYKKETFADFLPKVEIIPGYIASIPEPEDVKALNVKLQSVWLKESPKIIFSKTTADFNSQWDAYKAQMEKEGVKKAEDIYNETWKTYIDLYNKSVK